LDKERIHVDYLASRNYYFPCQIERKGGDFVAAIQKSVDSSSLAEVVDRILDKGVVIDLWAKVSLVGIELLTVEARVVIASVETWLVYAERVGLLKTSQPAEEAVGL
jgi:gas vesicle structural protein